MIDFLAELGAPTIFALTKIDKLGRAAQLERADAIRDALGLDSDQVIPFSAVTNSGRDELAEAIVAIAAQPSWRNA